MNRTNHAIAFAGRGYHVFPLGDPGADGKRPRIKGWQTLAVALPAERAGKAAWQHVIDRIHDWWERWPDANIGVALRQHQYVLDADGPDQVAYVEAADLRPTLTVLTGRGAHYYFSCPGPRLRNLDAVDGVAGLEGKTLGKLVVAPGSVHKDGTHYIIGVNKRPQTMPDWLRTLVGERADMKTGPGTPTEATTWAQNRWTGASPAIAEFIAKETLAEALAWLRFDLPGADGWATQFFKHSARVGTWVGRGVLDYEATVDALESLFFELDNGQGGKPGVEHVCRSIRNGVTKGARKEAQS